MNFTGTLKPNAFATKYEYRRAIIIQLINWGLINSIDLEPKDSQEDCCNIQSSDDEDFELDLFDMVQFIVPPFNPEILISCFDDVEKLSKNVKKEIFAYITDVHFQMDYSSSITTIDELLEFGLFYYEHSTLSPKHNCELAEKCRCYRCN